LAAANCKRRDDINKALGIGDGRRHRNVEVRYSGPDGVTFDVSQTGTHRIQEMVEEVRTATGMTKPTGHLEHFDFHDLRRTMTTAMNAMGGTQFLADKITNHTDRSVGAVYNRYEYEAEKRDALTKWDAKLAQIVN
jgi:integrase